MWIVRCRLVAAGAFYHTCWDVKQAFLKVFDAGAK